VRAGASRLFHLGKCRPAYAGFSIFRGAGRLFHFENRSPAYEGFPIPGTASQLFPHREWDPEKASFLVALNGTRKASAPVNILRKFQHFERNVG
jgi:hypothetical protein